MMGKRISQSTKGRMVGKTLEGGKPSSPGMSNYSKPIKNQPTPPIVRVRDVPVIPYMRVQENTVSLPKYTAVASRSVDEGIGMDELDALQLELESLLCTAALRTRILQSEIENIDVNESKREKRGKAAGKQLQYPGKRKHPDDKSAKSKSSSAVQPKFAKFKNFTPVVASAAAPASGSLSDEPPLSGETTVKLEMAQFSAPPKNNAPYKFWTSVEPYCGPVTNEDLKYVESLLDTSGNVPPPPVPPLGRHYSEVWADEHLSDDQASSNPGRHKGSGAGSESSPLRKRAERAGDPSVAGPLAQRLVSALLEDGSLQYEAPDIKLKHVSHRNSASYRNSLTLERCLRKELIEQGILDPEDLPPLTNPADDEILTDIKKCLNELAILRKTNVRHLRSMVSLCKQEIDRNELKKKLDQVDAEVTEIYKKHTLARQKKRPLTKKEREDAWKVINEQIRLNNEINALPNNGPNS